MVKCVFCGKDEHQFRGINLIKNDGSVNYYCSSKCRKNALKLKRDRRKFKWTLAHKEERRKTIIKEDKKTAENEMKAGKK